MGIVKGFDQGSDSWKEWRMSKITATNIPIILGSNPFCTKLELFEEKLGLRPPQEMNTAMLRGQTLETEARKLASELIGIEFEPIIYESDKHPWLAASLDGISKSEIYILEIKCPKESTHLEACNENIPEYYMDQMQTQLLVTGAEICYYFSYRPEYKDQPYAIVAVYPNREKFKEIIAKGLEFYINMCTMNPPEEWKLQIK